jgi:hypothetical protein
VPFAAYIASLATATAPGNWGKRTPRFCHVVSRGRPGAAVPPRHPGKRILLDKRIFHRELTRRGVKSRARKTGDSGGPSRESRESRGSRESRESRELSPRLPAASSLPGRFTPHPVRAYGTSYTGRVLPCISRHGWSRSLKPSGSFPSRSSDRQCPASSQSASSRQILSIHSIAIAISISISIPIPISISISISICPRAPGPSQVCQFPPIPSIGWPTVDLGPSLPLTSPPPTLPSAFSLAQTGLGIALTLPPPPRPPSPAPSPIRQSTACPAVVSAQTCRANLPRKLTARQCPAPDEHSEASRSELVDPRRADLGARKGC